MYCGGVDDGCEMAGICGVLALAAAEATALAASFVAHVASAVFAAFRSSARVGFVMAPRLLERLLLQHHTQEKYSMIRYDITHK